MRSRYRSTRPPTRVSLRCRLSRPLLERGADIGDALESPAAPGTPHAVPKALHGRVVIPRSRALSIVVTSCLRFCRNPGMRSAELGIHTHKDRVLCCGMLLSRCAAGATNECSLIACSSTSCLIGFVRYAVHPAATHFSWSPFSAEAVSAMIGVGGPLVRLFPFADRARRGQAVHDGHLTVHQHEVVVPGGELLDRRWRRFRRFRPGTACPADRRCVIVRLSGESSTSRMRSAGSGGSRVRAYRHGRLPGGARSRPRAARRRRTRCPCRLRSRPRCVRPSAPPGAWRSLARGPNRRTCEWWTSRLA